MKFADTTHQYLELWCSGSPGKYLFAHQTINPEFSDYQIFIEIWISKLWFSSLINMDSCYCLRFVNQSSTCCIHSCLSPCTLSTQMPSMIKSSNVNMYCMSLASETVNVIQAHYGCLVWENNLYILTVCKIATKSKS